MPRKRKIKKGTEPQSSLEDSGSSGRDASSSCAVSAELSDTKNKIETSDGRKRSQTSSCVVLSPKCSKRRKCHNEDAPSIVKEDAPENYNLYEHSFASVLPISTLNIANTFTKQSSNSPDSTKTVIYDYETPSPPYGNGTFRSFSPLPSTSKDSETFEKNDQRFKKSLICIDDDDVQIIDVPCETIIIDDNGNSTDLSSTKVVVDEEYDDVVISYSSISKFEPEHNVLEDNNSDCEIVDVDNLIAENRILLEKFKKSDIPKPIIENVPAVSELIEGNNIDEVEDSDTHQAEQVSSVPVSTSTQTSNTQTIPDVVAKFFSSNPQPPSLVPKDSPPVVDFLSGIMGFMLSALKAMDSRGSGQISSRQEVNNYANRLRIVDTVELDCEQCSPPSAPPGLIPLARRNTECVSVAQPKRKKIVKKASEKQPQSELQASSPTNDKPTKPGISAECPVCMESLANKKIAATICGHLFCLDCIKKVMALNYVGTKRCPVCRKALKKNSFHEIYL